MAALSYPGKVAPPQQVMPPPGQRGGIQQVPGPPLIPMDQWQPRLVFVICYPLTSNICICHPLFSSRRAEHLPNSYEVWKVMVRVCGSVVSETV